MKCKTGFPDKMAMSEPKRCRSCLRGLGCDLHLCRGHQLQAPRRSRGGDVRRGGYHKGPVLHKSGGPFTPRNEHVATLHMKQFLIHPTIEFESGHCGGFRRELHHSSASGSASNLFRSRLSSRRWRFISCHTAGWDMD